MSAEHAEGNVLYIPNGTPCSELEKEVLTILMEECCEVAVAASKLIRFGKENRPDDGPQAGIANSVVLGREMGDLMCMLDRVAQIKLIDEKDWCDGYGAKLERLRKFMQHPLPESAMHK